MVLKGPLIPHCRVDFDCLTENRVFKSISRALLEGGVVTFKNCSVGGFWVSVGGGSSLGEITEWLSLSVFLYFLVRSCVVLFYC